DGDIDVLPLSRHIAIEESGQGAHERPERRCRVGKLTLRGYRIRLRFSRVAAAHHDPTHRPIDKVGTLPFAPGTRLAERRYRGHDQTLGSNRERIKAKAQAIEVAGLEVLEDNRGPRSEPPKLSPIPLGRQV